MSASCCPSTPPCAGWRGSTSMQATAVLVGNGRVLPRFEGLTGDGPWALFGPEGTLLAVYEAFRVDQVKPSVVLPTAIGS